MKWLLWLLGLFSAAVAIALATHNSGYVQFVYPPYKLEMSLTMFVIVALATFMFGYMMVRILIATLGLPQKVRALRAERASSKGRAAMLEALTAYFEGRFAVAEQAALKAMELGERSALNSILAARAAHELHEFDKRDAYLEDAEGKTVGDTTMRLLAKAEFQIDQAQPQSALDSLKQLTATGVHRHLGSLALELKAQQQAHNWDAALEVIDQMEQRNAIDEKVALQMRQQAWLERMEHAPADLAVLKQLWDSVPPALRRRSKLVAAMAEAYQRAGHDAEARQLLVDSLSKQWDGELVSLLGVCHGASDVPARIEQGEGWLEKHPHDAALLLALGKLCLQQGLPEKSRGYLEASLKLQPGSEVFKALGQLAEKDGRMEEAARYLQQAAQAQ